MALGDTLTWKDGRQTSDTAEYVFEFPRVDADVLVAARLRTRVGLRNFLRAGAHARHARLDQPTGSQHTARGSHRHHAAGPDGEERSHVGNWFDCVRSRQTPNAPIQAGFAHAVACCLGREAERTGKRVRYDAATRRILEAAGRSGDSLG